MNVYHPALLLTGVLLTVLSVLGLSLQLGWRKAASRRPHHVLFFAVCAGIVVCLGLAWWAGERGWALLPALALLLLMPRTRPGRAGHWRLGLACVLAYGLGAWGAW